MAAETPAPQASWLTTLLTHHVAVLALGGALGGAVPAVWNEVKAWRLGVRANQVQIAEQQTRLWEKNLACLTERGVWEVDGPEGLVVKVSLCATGDILARYYQNDWAPQMRWIERPTPMHKEHQHAVPDAAKEHQHAVPDAAKEHQHAVPDVSVPAPPALRPRAPPPPGQYLYKDDF